MKIEALHIQVYIKTKLCIFFVKLIYFYHRFLIGRGTLELHPSLKYLEMDEETWFMMSEDECQQYTDMVFKIKPEEVEFVNCQREESLNRTIPYEGNDDTELKDSNETSTPLNPLEVLSYAALQNLNESGSKNIKENNLSLAFDEFKTFLPQYSSDTVRRIYQKAYQLKNNARAITFVPGCDVKWRMVISARFKDKPHLVKKR